MTNFFHVNAGSVKLTPGSCKVVVILGRNLNVRFDKVRPFVFTDPQSFRPDALNVEKKVAVTLNYLKNQVNNFSISLPCLSRTTKAVCATIILVMGPAYLKVPD